MSFRNTVCAMALAAGWVVAAQAQSVYLVQISDMADADSYEVMTREEVTKLQKEIAEEAKVFPAALAAVKKAWDADELTEKTPFPASKLGVRKMRQQGPFSQEQAMKKKEKAVERLDEELVKAMDAKKKKGTSEAAKAEAAKEAKREQAVADAHEKLREKMKELLKREVPKNGF